MRATRHLPKGTLTTPEKQHFTDWRLKYITMILGWKPPTEHHLHKPICTVKQRWQPDAVRRLFSNRDWTPFPKWSSLGKSSRLEFWTQNSISGETRKMGAHWQSWSSLNCQDGWEIMFLKEKMCQAWRTLVGDFRPSMLQKVSKPSIAKNLPLISQWRKRKAQKMLSFVFRICCVT